MINTTEANALRLIYVIGTYPGLTTTFIDREIKSLRQLGAKLQVVSIRRPPASPRLSADQQALQKDVIYLLPINWLSFILGNLYFVLLRPHIYFKMLIYLFTCPHPDGKARLKTLLHFVEGVYAAYLLRRQSFDQLHAHFIDRAAVVALVVSRFLKKPYSLTAHANDIYVHPILLPEKVKEAKFVSTCTAYNKAHLSQQLGHRLNGKLHLLYHGLDLAAYQPAPMSSRSNPPLLLSVGRLTEKKGFNHLIAACHRLQRRGYNFTCQIIGEGPLRETLQQQITELGLSEVVTLCGAMPFEAVIAQYRQATLFVLPCMPAENGDRDGIPNVLIEAMAMQLPVVSTHFSGIPELVQDRVNGLLVPPSDEEALTNALAELFDKPALRTELGQRGRYSVVEKFDATHNGQRLFDLFTT
jgi:colanic acid/amylovoran biosynthesis glycosyltransferase